MAPGVSVWNQRVHEGKSWELISQACIDLLAESLGLDESAALRCGGIHM